MLAGNSAGRSPLTQNLRHIEIGDVKLRQLAVASLNSMEEDLARAVHRYNPLHPAATQQQLVHPPRTFNARMMSHGKAEPKQLI